MTLRSANAAGSNISQRSGYITVTAPAPTVTGISPASGTRWRLVSITDLSGTGFRKGAKVFFNKSGSPTIAATNVSVKSATKLTCTVRIPGSATIGPWDVMVKNADGKSGKKVRIFTVKTPLPPTVSSITPATGKRGLRMKINNLSGTGFVGTPKPTVQFLKGTAILNATNVTVLGTMKLNCTLKIPAGAATGPWNVKVTNGDKQAGTRAGLFNMTG